MQTDSSANLEMLFQEQLDFDADIRQPWQDAENYDEANEDERERGEVYSPAKHTTDFCEYFRRLEDICEDYMERYIFNIVFNIRFREGSGGLKVYDKLHRVQPTLISLDDNDDVTELADLQLQQTADDWSMESKHKARLNLPYTIKRLHNLSMYCGIHMLSMISSYVKAKRINAMRQSNGSTMSLKKNAVIEHNVYVCKPDGTIGKKIEVSNKNQKAAEMFDWIIGVNPKYPSYREDFNNFLHYCKVLNIDIENDDMTKYDNDFVDSLVVLTLTPDSQYNKAVYNNILNPEVIEEKPVDVYLETMSTFREIVSVNEHFQKLSLEYDSLLAKRNMDVAKEIHSYYSIMFLNKFPQDNLYKWEEGFLYYDGELVVLNTQLVSNTNFAIGECIVSELGYIIHVSDLMALDVMTTYVGRDNMQTKYIQKDTTQPLAGWIRMSA